MSLAILKSRAQIGTDAPPVLIEVFLSGGLPCFSIVGMPETAVRESRDRVRSALLSSGFRLPQERITVSLGPADMRKAGGRFDLAIAVGILAASRQVPVDAVNDIEFYGELSLNGDVRPVPAILPAALAAANADHRLVVPAANATEAALADVTVLAVSSLLELTAHLHDDEVLVPVPRTVPAADSGPTCPDLADVKGQPRARRALEIAAAGGHNMLYIGPPGTGKSMLARRLPGILPPMTAQEALETAAVESLLGTRLDLSRWCQRPFRAPHHSASAPALVGGGRGPLPGEISRAHNGVLFLDELPEFNRNVLEALREPLEAGAITISRANRQAEYPARVQLVAAMNPCPCGFLGDEKTDCGCSAERVAGYRGKLSGPLLDRIDLQIEVGRPPRAALLDRGSESECSAEVAFRVRSARERQLQRAGCCNARLSGEMLEAHCELDSACRRLLEHALDRLNLSARAIQRTLRVARSIADLGEREIVNEAHVAEALSLRLLDAPRY